MKCKAGQKDMGGKGELNGGGVEEEWNSGRDGCTPERARKWGELLPKFVEFIVHTVGYYFSQAGYELLSCQFACSLTWALEFQCKHKGFCHHSLITITMIFFMLCKLLQILNLNTEQYIVLNDRPS